MIAACAVYMAAAGWLLWTAGKNRGMYALAKGVCSALFVALAPVCFVGGAQNRPLSFGLFMGGLVMCGFGDVFLGMANRHAAKVSKKPFLTGACAFMAAHLLLCAALYVKVPFFWYDLAGPAVCAGILALLRRYGAVRLKKLWLLGYAYILLIGLMSTKAMETGEIPLMCGAALFLLSDVILLFLYFGHARYSWLRCANLVIYYSGMFFLAFSAGSL